MALGSLEVMNRFLSYVVLFALMAGGVGAAPSKEKIAGGLLKWGGKVWQAEKERRKAEKQAGDDVLLKEIPEDGSAQDSADRSSPQKKKLAWHTRSRDLLSALAERTKSVDLPNPSGKALKLAFRNSVDGLVDQYKEQYKQEGRRYAHEVGDIIVERVRQDPKISSSISSLKALCWAVILYLTVVTMLVVSFLSRIRKTNRQLLEKLSDLERKVGRR